MMTLDNFHCIYGTCCITVCVHVDNEQNDDCDCPSLYNFTFMYQAQAFYSRHQTIDICITCKFNHVCQIQQATYYCTTTTTTTSYY